MVRQFVTACTVVLHLLLGLIWRKFVASVHVWLSEKWRRQDGIGFVYGVSFTSLCR